MTTDERSWTRAILAAFAPEGGPGLSPRAGEVDYLHTFRRMSQAATRKAAFGLRVAIFVVALSPLWLGHRLRLFSQLPVGERAALLARLLSHRWFAVRELTLLLKFVAAMALLGHEDVRARSGYDNLQAEELSESGVRHRLPLLPQAPDAPDTPGDVG